MNRGSRGVRQDLREQYQPSMRPRFMNRGSLFGAFDVFRRRFPSMRPRFMNRGSRQISIRATLSKGSFNEAPIHESGKS